MHRPLAIALFITGCSGQPYRSDCLGPDSPAEAIDAEPRSLSLDVPVSFAKPAELPNTTTTISAVGSERSLGFTRTVSLWDECLTGALIQQEATVSFQITAGDDTFNFETEGYVEFSQAASDSEVAIVAHQQWPWGKAPEAIERVLPDEDPEFTYSGVSIWLMAFNKSGEDALGFFYLAVDRQDDEQKRTLQIITANLGSSGERNP